MVFQEPNSTICVLFDSQNTLSAFGTNARQANLTGPIAKPHPRKYLKQEISYSVAYTTVI